MESLAGGFEGLVHPQRQHAPPSRRHVCNTSTAPTLQQAHNTAGRVEGEKGFTLKKAGARVMIAACREGKVLN
jgi:hypothetical protein